MKDSESTQIAQRSAFYDNLKYILITLVVIGHLTESLVSSYAPGQACWRFIYLFHMPAFLFVGGMFGKKMYTRENGLKINSLTFYLIMFLIFDCALWAWRHLWDPNPPFSLTTVGGIPWYFLTLATLGLSTPVIAKVSGGAKVVIPASIIIAVISGFDSNCGDFLALGRTFSYAPFYYAGYFLSIKGFANTVESLQSKRWPIAVACIFLAIVLACLIVMPDGLSKAVRLLSTGHNPYSSIKAYPSYISALIKLIVIVVAFAMTFCICLITPTKRCRISDLGSRTLQVYVLHAFFYTAMNGFGFFEALKPYLPLSMLLMVLAGIALTWALAKPKILGLPFEKLRRAIHIDAYIDTPRSSQR